LKKESEKTVAIVEARMTSSRLPGKHLLYVNNRPIIGYLIDRLKSVSSINHIVIAMTSRESDDPLENYVKSLGIDVFRGDENDVMGRVLNAALANDADLICEVTGDCPIIDPVLIEQAIKTYKINNVAYVNNGRFGLPDGMGCQVFATKDLALSERLTKDSLDREHVTLHIRRNQQIFPSIYISPLKEYTWPELALTLDELSDYILLKKIIEYFEPNNPLFDCLDVIRLLKQNPDWLMINQKVIRKGDS